MIEAALPMGAIDTSEDRWGDDFVIPWREAVAVAADAVSLMQCQIMLEYGIRTFWLKPTGLKLLSCLPSRVQCMKNATLGMVAIRIWVLDMTIKYENVKQEEKEIESSSKTNNSKSKPTSPPLSTGTSTNGKRTKK
jgi:hypothetical protein